ncbi:MAG TPA: hypothetical protein ENG87_00860, partial [Candidatus Pacearchaeota archaeon]|nr:hypothetical protein [Candidatus Pacearchaeota archaeon]
WTKEKIIQEVFSLERKQKRRPTKHDYSNLYTLSKKHFGSWSNMMKYAGYNVKSLQKPTIPDLNSNSFHYFLGLLYTDGHVVFDKLNQTYKIMLFTSYVEEKNMIVRLIKNLFNYKASIRLKKYGFNKRINHEIYISSKKLCGFLIKEIKFPAGAKSLTVRLPNIVLKDPSKAWHFIRGVFDGDGSIINTEKAYFLKICSGSKRFINDLGKLMVKLGFKGGIIRQEREKLWVWKINKKKDLKRFYQLAYKDCNGYYYQRKKLKW